MSSCGGKTRGLHVGDSVGLTFLAALKAFAGETLLGRISSMRGDQFGANWLTSLPLTGCQMSGPDRASPSPRTHPLYTERTAKP